MIDVRDLLLYMVLAKSRGVELCFDAGEEGIVARMYRSSGGTHIENSRIMTWAELKSARIDLVDRIVNDMAAEVLTASQPMVEAIKGGAPHYTLPA